MFDNKHKKQRKKFAEAVKNYMDYNDFEWKEIREGGVSSSLVRKIKNGKILDDLVGYHNFICTLCVSDDYFIREALCEEES